MGAHRVKFFSATDMSCGFYLEIAEQVIKHFDDREAYTNVNDIIELYNIKRFFDHKIFLKEWSEEDKTKYSHIVDKFPKHIGRYFASISDQNFLSIFESVELKYTGEFWILINHNRVYQKISYDVFKQSFSLPNFRLYEVLKQKKITRYFGSVLREYILSETKYAELILDKFAVQQSGKHDIYFPSEITGKEMEELILRYIHSSDPSLNYLELITNTPCTDVFPISDMTRLEAKRRHQFFVEKHFERNKGFEFGVEISFSENQKEEKLAVYNEGISKISYSLTWIRENLDFPTLLNNFIYLFEYTDMQFRSQHVQNGLYMGILESLVGIRGQKHYKIGIAFRQTQYFSVVQMAGYRKILDSEGIRLEDVFQWFFSDYLKEEFGTHGFYVSMPSKESTFLEKCRTIAPEIERVLKQFSNLVELGHIDHELIQISSHPFLYKDVPSFIKRKYLYGKGESYNRAVYNLFSNQSMLHYVPRFGAKYNSFFDLLCHEKISPDDYTRHESELEWLINQGLVRVNDEGSIEMCPERVLLLRDLYKNEVSCKSYLEMFKDAIHWMEKQDMVEYGSTLLSRPEQDYLNYLLNRSEFSNGLDLRNKYLHGTHTSEEKIHMNDYIIFLNVLALIIIKINEEFCLRQELIQEEETH